jgi:ABC-type transport system involved in multi-copper enzyme maturation permease subunit
MKILRKLYHLARADFLERIRRYSFLIVLALAVWAGYLFVPPEGAGYRVLQVGVQRGIYNSAWIGLMFGLIAALYLPLFGFYLVKNAVERDRHTGVGQIIATTPISKPMYVLGKWLSNLAVLVLILSIITVMAVVMQLVRGEQTTINLWALVIPIWLMGLPVITIAAAMSVFFECVSFLRGGLGNLAFLFLWLTTIGVVMSNSVDEATDVAKVTRDPYGYTQQLVDIQAQVLSDEPDAELGTGLIVRGRDIERTFVWEGIDWTAGIVLERMLWAGMGLAIAMAAAVPFDRFDLSRSRPKSEQPRLLQQLGKRAGALQPGSSPRQPSAAMESMPARPIRLTPLVAKPVRWRFIALMAAELKLMLKERSLIWFAGACGLIVACLVSPMSFVRQYLIPIVWIWPLLVWSQIGNRERRYNTDKMVFSTSRPVLRQLPALWLAGFALTIAAGSGVLMRLALSGEITELLGWLVGAIFAPTLALALGVWVGNKRAFEIIYPLWWYLGVVNQVPIFDYAGVTSADLAIGMPVVYLGITTGLLVLAVIGRWRQASG